MKDDLEKIPYMPWHLQCEKLVRFLFNVEKVMFRGDPSLSAQDFQKSKQNPLSVSNLLYCYKERISILS